MNFLLNFSEKCTFISLNFSEIKLNIKINLIYQINSR